MEDIYKQIQSAREREEKGAMASVVSRRGSAPMSADAKFLVFQDGSWKGTIGGGCLEAEVWAEAKKVMLQDEPIKKRFELTDKEAIESGHICGGIVDVLIEPFSNYESKLLSEIIRLRSEESTGVLASVVGRNDEKPPGPESRILIYRDGKTLGNLEGLETQIVTEATQVMQDGRPAIRIFSLPNSDVQLEVFLEPIVSYPKVYIFGGGHVSKQISKVASVAGLRVIIVEDRPHFANREQFPDAEEFIIVEDFENLHDAMPEIDPKDMAVIVTRGHQHDETTLCWAWDKPLRYLGMIGSRTKILITYKRLGEKMGVPREAFLKRVHAPIGLEIGADTPGEIAVAIVAELIQIRRESLIREPELAGRPKSAALMKLAKAKEQTPSEKVSGALQSISSIT